MGSPHLSRAPFSGLTCSPEISSLTGQPSSLPRPILSRPPPPSSPTPQALPRPGGCFEPSSPHLGRPSCREPILSGSSPPSPCVERFRLVGSPPARQRSPHCSWISPPRTPRPCPRGPYIDQHSYLYYYGGYPPALVTNPVTSPPLTHVPLETGPVISPPLTHRSLGTGLVISPPLAHRHMETRPIISPSPQRILDTGPMTSTLLSSWSSGRSYNDPPLSSASSPPTDNFYHGHVKRPDSHEPKPQLDPTFGKNYCGSPLSSQPGTSSCPSSPQEGSYHYSHLPPEAHIPAPGNPYYAIHLSPGSTGNPQLQDSSKSCFESIYSWETGGSSYLRITPGAMISGPTCPQEPPLPLSSHCPCSAFFPSPPGNQFMNPPQSPPCRSCKESPLPVPICPQAKSPKSSEVKQPHSPHRCHSLVTEHTPDQLSAPKPSSSPPPPSRPSGVSGPSCMVTTITTCSNSCPKELPQGTTAPAVVPRTLKTVIPASLPLRLPCDPILPSSYAQTSPRGPPCSTHVYSMVTPTLDPGLLSGPLNQCTGPLQCHNQPVVPPGGTYGTPRGPLQPHRQPVVPPCSTHIYSFIPLRTPFDPQNLPIAPRARGHLDAMPCGLHVYSMASRDSHKESSQIPYSCPVPSTKSSSCSTSASCSSLLVISECQSSDSKNIHQSASGSQSESAHCPSTTWTQRKTFHLSRSRSGSNSTQESTNKNRRESPLRFEDQCQSESTRPSKSQGPIKSALRNRSRSPSKSPHRSRRQGHSRSRSKTRPHCGKSPGRSKSPHRSRGQGRSKSPRRNKK